MNILIETTVEAVRLSTTELRDVRLSYAARGLLAYLRSFHGQAVPQVLGPDASEVERAEIEGAVRELEGAGYLRMAGGAMALVANPASEAPFAASAKQPAKRKAKVEAVRPDDVTEEVWADFLRLRAAKHAPLTATALDGIRREAERANWSLQDAIAECCQRGWQGFKASWVAARRQASQSYADRMQQKYSVVAPRAVARPILTLDELGGQA